MKTITKRDGTVVPFSVEKITDAICKAFMATEEASYVEAKNASMRLSRDVAIQLDAKYGAPVYIEKIQDEVEQSLMRNGYCETAKAYILYRNERERQREKNSRLMRTLDNIVSCDAKDSDLKRENANIDGNTAMGTMLKFGSESAKSYYCSFMLSDRVREAHENGDIHIHDLDFYNLTMTCCQIDLTRLFKGGFSTGHGFLREPNSIASYGALAAIALQANQNDMHGGQSVPSFDRDMAPGVAKTYAKVFESKLSETLPDRCGIFGFEKNAAEAMLRSVIGSKQEKPALRNTDGYDEALAVALFRLIWDEYIIQRLSNEPYMFDEDYVLRIITGTRGRVYAAAERQTHQAMESLIGNLNTMHSRAGAQVPFTSLNYGTDTSPEGRMVVRSLLKATIEGLGNGETPIFPIQVFRLMKGVNMDSGDPNYDLFRLALECSSKRMFPNFSFQDAGFNAKYYVPGKPQTEIAYMGCRTRVIGNVYDSQQEVSYSRGNLSFTTINLPRLAIKSGGCVVSFYCNLGKALELVASQLLERLEIQSSKKAYNFPFLMGQGVWLGSDRLAPGDTVSEVIRHGTLSVGFIGLAETLIRLFGKHHGESDESQRAGLDIVKYMRTFCDRKSEETGLNFTLLATPAEGLSGRFARLDRKRFGAIPGVTDKEYYTNSFHIPVSYMITAAEKIWREAPYHELTNAGHISYIELDGNLADNLDAFERVIRYMGECGIGYGAVNHPLDRDPVCGYSGVIGDTCPGCGRSESGGVPFERIRRITGYLVGSIERFNDAKRTEERDRVKHCL